MITFGIITNKQHHATNQHQRLQAMICSIEDNQIPNCEIIIIGDYKVHNNEYNSNIKCIPFDDSIKPGWITKKKNMITQHAKYDIIVYMHDYIILAPNWYQEFVKFGTDWDLCMHQIVNKDGTRFRDWCVFKYDGHIGANGAWRHSTPKHPDHIISPYIPSYDYNRTENLYISGSYWVAKKYVMEQEPLDEDFVWGQPEDIEWSLRVIPKYKYVMNPNCKVHLLHQKDPVWSPL